MVWSSTLASNILRRRNLFKARCDRLGMIGTPLSTTRFSSRGASIVLEISEMFCSAGARSCHKQNRHHLQLCRRSGAEVVCCCGCSLYHAGEMEALVQARGVIKANQGPTTSVIEHMPPLLLGRLRAGQSQITDAMLWYAPWLCLGLYRSERQRRV